MAVRRSWLLPLVPLYAAGLACKNVGYDWRPGRGQRLADPVVSVGSLSAGGAGKTPFVIALAEALRRAGYGIDVLSRGHGRTSTLDLRVDPNGSANDYGDEPLLLARRLACPVYVAEKRFQAGTMAERDRRVLRADRHLSLHLLDDGFQHRQLARAVDIVLLTSEDVSDTLLPAGNLRESLRALRRADIIVVREEESRSLQLVMEGILAAKSKASVWTIQRRSGIVEGTVAQRPLAFCGLARPQGFRESLAVLGVRPVGFNGLKDHQTYRAKTINKLIEAGRAAGADGFVTTAKDAVKLTPGMRNDLRTVGSLAVCDVAVSLLDEANCVSDILTRVQAGWQRRLQP